MQDKVLKYNNYNNAIYRKIYFDKTTGGFVVAHKQHAENEFEENSMIAIKLAKNGEAVELLPLLHEFYTKYPDAKINEIIADFKYPQKTKNLHNALQHHIQKANEQGAEIVVIYLNDILVTKRDLARALTASTSDKRNSNICEIWLLFADNQLIKFNRNEIRNKTYLDKI